MTLHDLRLSCPNGLLMINEEHYCYEELCISGNPLFCLKNKCKRNSFTLSLLVTFEQYLNKAMKYYDNVDLFISPSKALYDMTVKSGIPESKITFINNFIDDSSLEIKPEYNHEGYFLFSGRLVSEKGIFYILEAMKQLPDIPIHIAGAGNEEEKVRKIVAEANINNVKLLGYQSGEDLEMQYKNCIATIAPSYYFENCPYTIIESFLYGKPVIASDIGGMSEMVKNNENGFKIQPGNISQLVKYIETLYNNKELVIKLGKNARKEAEQVYNSSLHYDKIIQAYEDTLKRVQKK